MFFFIVLGNELKAWAICKGANAVAAGKIHANMARGFIKAEFVHFNDLKKFGSMEEVKAKGKMMIEEKDYIIQDDDIITLRFNV